MGNKKFKLLSIIIPVYNEEQYIGETLRKVIQADTLQMKKEIIIVDDGSTDKTFKHIKSQIINKKSIVNNKKIMTKLMHKSRNKGKGAALKTGFLLSTGDIVLVQDADFEYKPDEYALLLEPFFTYNADVVYGSRFVTDRPRRILYFWHYVANQILTGFSNMLTNLNITDMETGYKVFKGDLIRRIAKKLKSDRFGFEPEITARIAKENLNIYEVGISYQGRTYGEGKKIRARDAVRTIWEIIKYNLFVS